MMNYQIILSICIVLFGVCIPGILADGNSTNPGDMTVTPPDVQHPPEPSTEQNPIQTITVEPTVINTIEPTSTQDVEETITPEATPTITVEPTSMQTGEETITPEVTPIVTVKPTDTRAYSPDESKETLTTNLTTNSDDSVGTSETNSSTTDKKSDQTSGNQNTSQSAPQFISSFSSSDEEKENSKVVTLGTVIVSSSGTSNAISINQTGGIAGNAGYTWTSSDSYIISSPGSYRLDEDISTSTSYAIQIVASDVTLDGNGHTITGDGWSGTAGVEVKSGANNVAIENIGLVSGYYFGTGIESWADDTTIHNNSISESFRGIYTTGLNATIDDNTVNGGGYDGWGVKGIETSGNYAKITNNSITGTAMGIESHGKSAAISNNTIDQNYDTGIYSASGTINTQTIISNNSISGIGGANNGIESESVNTSILNNVVKGYSIGTLNQGTGINSKGTNSVIDGNEVSDNVQGIAITGNNVTISKNTIYDNSGDGISLGSGENRTITKNTITENKIGISTSDNFKSTKITSNKIRNNDEGIHITNGGGGGDGNIVNNYLGNDENIGGNGDASVFKWNVYPTPGTNVVGGPSLAGNYWSDETETGWSDQQEQNEVGYTTTPYQIATEVFDHAPLVKTTTTPTTSPTPTVLPTPTLSPTPTTIPLSDSPNQISDSSSSIPGIHLGVVTVSLPPETKPGDVAELQLTLENSGSTTLSKEARIILSPINPLAQIVGEQPAIYENGKYLLTFQIQIPKDPGTYIYIFNPVYLSKDPTTGKDIRIPTGDPVQFTVTVGPDGTVMVRTP